MTFLPIVERELRVGARRASTYWIRFAAAACVLGIWLALAISSRGSGTAELSKNLFTAFGVIALGFCLVTGIFLTADCLSEEKREGTLGLLFLTDLRGYDVVLGKLMGTSIRSANGLAAIFPILGLPLLMGGVTRGEFWRVILALLTTLLFSLNLGMLMSALNRETRQAMSSTFLGLLVFAGFLPATWWLALAVHIGWPAAISLLPSPVHLFGTAFDSHYRTAKGPQEFWTSFVIVFSLALGFLSVAAMVLPTAWREGKALAGDATGNGRGSRSFAQRCSGWVAPAFRALRIFTFKRAFIAGLCGLLLAMVAALSIELTDSFKGVERNTRWVHLTLFLGFGYLGILVAIRGIKAGLSTAERSQIMERNPFCWLASRDNLSKGIVWIVISLLFVLFACFFVSAIFWKARDAFVLCLLSSYALHQVFKLTVAIEATRSLSEARRNGTLELLLVSPLEETKIIEGQYQALKAHFGGVQRFILGINICLCAGATFFPESLSMGQKDQGIFLELFMGGMLMLLLDFKAISSVGMLMALQHPRHNRATLMTCFRVMLIPWAAIFVLVFLGISRALNRAEPFPIFFFWFVLGTVTDLSVGAQARVMLSRGVRKCLDTRSESPDAGFALKIPLPVAYQHTNPSESSHSLS